ncbi:MAG: hypothetical protein MI806_09245 [Minwuiales bacterium]|nr:hypothetical protein [Minwuiales bacterium]
MGAQDKIIVEPQFRGPPESGNGGYVSGLMARHLKGAEDGAEVTLRLPIPLGRELTLEARNGTLALTEGDALIAEARAKPLHIDVPEPPDFADVAQAAEHGGSFEDSPYNDCFVCGRQRAVGTGLRVFAGAVNGRRIVAAPWIPYAELADGTGKVDPMYHWGALDCPGAEALSLDERRPITTGRMHGRVERPVEIGEKCRVIGWEIARDGRKHYSGTAVFKEDGTLSAAALTTWIEIKSPS